MTTEEDVPLIEFCIERHYHLLAIYHDKPRVFIVRSIYAKENGLWYLAAHDSTHQDESHTRSYRLDELLIVGIGRTRPVRLMIRRVLEA